MTVTKKLTIKVILFWGFNLYKRVPDNADLIQYPWRGDPYACASSA